ncbi:MAG: DUF3298 and DUF4163 domain-containing protein [Clostridiales bacterium]|jgi:hypothetical protein|nr:DUF3298 and DUF4163 domain-containing protein [Clostridiales bacterium]
MSGQIGVETKSLVKSFTHDNTTVLTYTIHYPQFASALYPVTAQMINAYYRNRANHLARRIALQMYPQAVEGYRDSVEQGYPFNEYQVFRTFEVTYAQGCLASLYLDLYQYTGGAHGTTVRSSDTWDLSRAERLPIRAVFPGNPDYRADLIAAVQAEIRRNSDLYFDNAVELAEENFDENNFYLTPDALVIYYQQYDIAPYAYGIPQFRIPYGTYGATLPRCSPYNRSPRARK